MKKQLINASGVVLHFYLFCFTDMQLAAWGLNNLHGFNPQQQWVKNKTIKGLSKNVLHHELDIKQRIYISAK